MIIRVLTYSYLYFSLENQPHKLGTELLFASNARGTFRNIETEYEYENVALAHRVDDAPRIGDIFVRIAPFFKMYAVYTTNYDTAMRLIDEWSTKSPEFAGVVQEIQRRPQSCLLTLQHHMLEPIQRLPRYELLLKSALALRARHTRYTIHDTLCSALLYSALSLVTRVTARSVRFHLCARVRVRSIPEASAEGSGRLQRRTGYALACTCAACIRELYGSIAEAIDLRHV